MRYHDRMESRGESVAGSLILLARESAQLSQRALAIRAGTSQNAIAAYEANRRQPTVPTLYRILAAAGVEPRIRLEPLDDHDAFVAEWEAAQPDRAAWDAAQRELLRHRA